MNHQSSTQKEQPFIYLQQLGHRQALAAVLTLLAGFIIFRWQAVKKLSQAFLGGYEGDSGLYIYLLQSNCYDLFRLPWYSTRAFYPYSLTLAWSDNFILPAMLTCPLLKVGLPLALVYNLILISAIFLNGYLIFRLSYLLGATFSAALTFGLTAMLAATLSGQLGHPQLQFLFFLPLGWIVFLHFLAKPRFLTAVLVGVTVWLSFLTTVYYAIYLPLSLAGMMLALMLLRPQHFKLLELSKLLLGTLLGSLPLLPFLAPYLNVRAAFGPRGLHEPAAFAANSLAYLSAPPTSLLYSFSAQLSHSEAHLFPGILTLLLLAFAFWRCFGATKALRVSSATLLVALVGLLLLPLVKLPPQPLTTSISLLLWVLLVLGGYTIFLLGKSERSLGIIYLTNRNIMAVFMFAALFFFVLSFGPLVSSPSELTVPSPYYLFSLVWPGLNALRATGRMGLVVLMALFVLAALALSYLQRKHNLSRRVLVTILLLCLVEQITPIYPLQRASDQPFVLKELQARLGTEDAVLFLPFTANLDRQGQVASWGNFARYNVNYMNWSVDLAGRLVNGYSGQRSRILKEFPLQMNNFPDLRSIYIAQRIVGLRQIVYVANNNPSFDKENFENNLKKFANQLKVITIDADNNYLIELIGHAPVDKEFFLMLPTDRPYTLSFELQAPFHPGEDLELIAQEDPKRGAQLREQFSVPQDGLWHSYQITIPRRSRSVTPAIIRFRGNALNQTIIRNSRLRISDNS